MSARSVRTRSALAGRDFSQSCYSGQRDESCYLTVSGCPLRDTITREVTAAVSRVPGVTSVRVELDVMSDEQRRELAASLRGGQAEREIPFAQPGSLTRVYAVASGKGGVGKSSVTVNLAAAMAADGLKVGVVDADIYGHSVPRMLGAEETLELTGHPVGGVCPFGLKTPLPVYLDRSLQAFDIVYPAGGSLNTSVEVGVERLFELVAERWVDLCRPPEPQA